MTRTIKTIEIEGQQAVALFDTGAVLTYVREHLLASAPRKPVVEPFRVALGGRSIEVRELCLIGGRIEGLAFDTDAVPVQELDRADGHELDVIIGALAMERWEIKLDPRTGTLDPSTGSGQASRGSSGVNSPSSGHCDLATRRSYSDTLILKTSWNLNPLCFLRKINKRQGIH